MEIIRVTAVWSGFPGAPGYSNFHFAADPGLLDGGILTPDAEVAGQAASERVREAFQSMRDLLPSGVRISVENEVEVLDSDSGEVVGAVESDTAAVLSGGSTGGWSGATGAVVNWRTNDYRFGRRIRGRTFLVPLNSSAYESDGTLSSGGRSTIQAFGAAMVDNSTAPAFGVWSRPRAGTGGVFATAVGSSVPDLAAVLRSRRD